MPTDQELDLEARLAVALRLVDALRRDLRDALEARDRLREALRRRPATCRAAGTDLDGDPSP